MAPKSSLASQSFRISLYSIAGILLGMGVHIVFAATLGTSESMDTFMALIAIPAAVNFVAQRTATMALVPIFHSQVEIYGREATLKSLGRAMTLALLIGLITLLVLALAASPMSRLMAPDSAANSNLTAVAGLFSLAAIAIVFDVARAFISAFSLANQRFFLYYLPILIKHATVIIGAWLAYRLMGLQGLISAWVIGSVLGCVVLIPLWVKHRLWGFPNRTDPGLKQLLSTLIPVMIAIAINETRIPLERLFASGLATGSVAKLAYADKIVIAVVSTIPMAISVASLTAYSKAAAMQDPTQMIREIRRSLQAITLVTLPISVFVYLLAEPGVRLLFERKSFTVQDTTQVAAVLRAYLLALVGTCFSPVFYNVLLCLRKTWKVVWVEACACLCMIVLMPIFAHSWGAQGIAWATSVACVFRVLVPLFFTRILLPDLNFAGFGKDLMKTSLACALMIGTLVSLEGLLPHSSQLGLLRQILQLALLGAVGCGIYLGTLQLSGMAPMRHFRSLPRDTGVADEQT